MASANPEVASLVRLLDHLLEETASEFGRNHWHSLIRNLSTVRPEDWDALPPGGGRTIRELTMHIGKAWPFYANHAFGDGTRAWRDDPVNGFEPGTTPESITAWLRAAHAEFRNAIAILSDDQLSKPCLEMEGGPAWDVRRLVENQIQHTLYHVGEINHLRALLQGNDQWGLDDMGREDND
jgi:hypothetical protein